jgi:dTDP-4-dehydrorhamnose reductase
MRVLILGGNGMLGHKLVQVLKWDWEVFSTIRRPFADVLRFGMFDEAKTIANIDVTHIDELRNVLSRVQPDVVINAVGIIKQVSSDAKRMSRVNSGLPKQLSELSIEFGFRLIGISTDCVFSGEKGNYDEKDIPDATDEYGKSKHMGEVIAENCLTIRTSIIGRELETAHSLVEWFLSNSGGRVSGYTHSIYSGFPTVVFAEILADLISNHRTLSGLYHISSDPINKFELLKLVNEEYNANIRIDADDTMAIDRSLDSSKFRSETGFAPESWPVMIERMAADPTPYDLFR